MTGSLFSRDAFWVSIAIVLATVGGVAVYFSPMLAVVALLGSVLIGALIARPVWGLPFLFLMLMISDAMPTGVQIVVYLTLSKGATLAVLGAWFLRCTLVQQFPLKWNALWLPMLASAVVLFVGLARAREISSLGIQFVVGFVLLIGMSQTLTVLGNPARMRGVLLVIALIFVGVSVLGIPLGGVNVTLEDYIRYKGFFQDPNEWSLALLLGVGPAVAILENRKNDLYRVIALIGIVATFVNILRSVSRAGILVMILILPFLVIILWRRKWLLVISGVAAVAAVVLLVDLEPLWIRFDSFFDAGEFETDGSMQTRTGLAEVAVNSFLENPLLGLGTMSFLQDVKVISGGHYDKVVHNTYLQVLTEQGILGAIPFAWMLGSITFLLGRIWVKQKTQQIRRLAIGFGTAFAAYGAMAFTLDLLTFTAAWFWLGMLVILDRLAALSPARLAEIGLADEDDPALAVADRPSPTPMRRPVPGEPTVATA